MNDTRGNLHPILRHGGIQTQNILQFDGVPKQKDLVQLAFFDAMKLVETAIAYLDLDTPKPIFQRYFRFDQKPLVRQIFDNLLGNPPLNWALMNLMISESITGI